MAWKLFFNIYQHSSCYFLRIWLAIHSKPWYNLNQINFIYWNVLNKVNSSCYPSPVRAQQAWICHLCFFIDVRFSWRDISAAVIDPLTSCLLASTRTADWCNSSWARILCSSCLVTFSLSRSVESTTNMTN